MKDLILDCSVTLAWLHDDGPKEYVRDVLTMIRKGATVFVPPLWLYELTNGLVMAERKRRSTRERIREFLDELESLPITFHAPDHWSGEFHNTYDIMTIALANNLTAYDNAYLLTALQLRLPLASLDRDLKKAAQRAGIEDAVKGWT